MIRPLSRKMVEIRSEFLFEVRRFFRENGYAEVETPLMNPGGNIEAFLDSFRVVRSGVVKSPEQRAFGDSYLITSPEYNLKILLAEHSIPLFQIAHCFREGDSGGLHTEEFLMLEWYTPESDELQAMRFCEALLQRLCSFSWSTASPSLPVPARSIAELFREYVGCSLDYDDLYGAAESRGYLTLSGERPRYDELFFLLFLQLIEPGIARNGPEFIFGYPQELAALSRIGSDGRACRFELYWEGVEIANGYAELTGRRANLERFQHENRLRTLQKKVELEPEEQFLEAADRLPESAGVALGLDRLFMKVTGAETFSDVTPFL